MIRSWVRASRMASRATRTTSCPSTPRGATSRIAARRTRRARFPLLRRRSSCPRPARTPPNRERQTVPPASRGPAPHHRRRAGSPGYAPLRSAGDAEAATALASASGEDRPASTGPHPQTETVRLRTAARVRLVRTPLGHPRIPSRKEGRQRRRPKGKYTETSLGGGVDNRKCVKTVPPTRLGKNPRCYSPPRTSPG